MKPNQGNDYVPSNNICYGWNCHKINVGHCMFVQAERRSNFLFADYYYWFVQSCKENVFEGW